MKRFLIVTLGYYGRGATVAEAFENVKKAGADLRAVAVLQVGKTELVFRDIMHVEGEVDWAVRVPRLSCLRGWKEV